MGCMSFDRACMPTHVRSVTFFPGDTTHPRGQNKAPAIESHWPPAQSKVCFPESQMARHFGCLGCSFSSTVFVAVTCLTGHQLLIWDQNSGGIAGADREGLQHFTGNVYQQMSVAAPTQHICRTSSCWVSLVSSRSPIPYESQP